MKNLILCASSRMSWRNSGTFGATNRFLNISVSSILKSVCRPDLTFSLM
jgi:hypothetical protein